MRHVLRPLICFALVLMVFAASIQLAAARGQSPAVDTLVICTGTGPIHILVDEHGQPTGGVMICPDYALAFFADITGTAAPVGHLTLWRTVWLGHTEQLAAGMAKPRSQPRGPPVSV